MPAEPPAGSGPTERVAATRAGASVPERLVVVVGTGTEVGKTWVSATLLRRLRASGHRVSARKPAQSFEAGEVPESTDAGALGAATGEAPETVCPSGRWYPVAMAPPMAAEVLGRPSFTVADLVAEIRWTPDVGVGVGVGDGNGRPGVGLVETAGGVRSPQAADGDAVDLARLLSPDLVLLVADAGLGTVNSVRLCVDALGQGLGAGGGRPRLLVVLNRFDPADDLHRRNRAWLSDRDGLAVLVTPGDEEVICRSVMARPILRG